MCALLCCKLLFVDCFFTGKQDALHTAVCGIIGRHSKLCTTHPNYMHPLIQQWRACPLASPPFRFLGDDVPFSGHSTKFISVCDSYDEYLKSPAFGDPRDTTLHLGLIPSPYYGNIESASIYMLMLNPGLQPIDYFAEHIAPEFRHALVRNLHQKQAQSPFPFIFLNPRFAWHSGFTYWQKKLHDVVSIFKEKRNLTLTAALSDMARRIVCLQLVPYHSRNFGLPRDLTRHLPSVQIMQHFIQEVVVRRVQTDEAIAIVLRGKDMWQMPRHKNIVVYDGSESRSAHLSLKSRGGKAIAARLGL
jgi:hypothetical protein